MTQINIIEVAATRMIDHLGPEWRHFTDGENKALVFKLGYLSRIWFKLPAMFRNLIMTKWSYKFLMRFWVDGHNWAVLSNNPGTMRLNGQFPPKSKINWQELLSTVVVEINEMIHA